MSRRIDVRAVALAAVLVLVPGAGAAQADGVHGDPLTGSGAVKRSALSSADLTSGRSTAPVADAAFALPHGAAPPRHRLEGTLRLLDTARAGGFEELVDLERATDAGDHPLKHLPRFGVTLVQSGSHLIPQRRGLTYTGSRTYNLIVSPGRVWSERGDRGMTRAALPFALVERNANCVHNGSLTFLFDERTTSKVRYQVTQETCSYRKNDMWGQVRASLRRHRVAGARELARQYATEVARRMPSKPLSALARDYPAAGLDLSRFGAGITREHMSAYGLVVRGVHYTAGCGTRHGTYPFCDQLVLPSYSTAKSAFAGVGYMLLAQRYGRAVGAETIARWIPETAQAKGVWDDVTLDDALDMTTGNFDTADPHVDEGGPKLTRFFLAESYRDRLAAALEFPRQAAPGTRWVYHTTDTFLALQAQNALLRSRAGKRAEIFATVRDDVFKPLSLPRESWVSLRTDNSDRGAAWGGYGLIWTSDSIAKLGRFLNNDGGRVGGEQVLHPGLLAASMQRDPADRGVSTGGSMYNNGFWALPFKQELYPRNRCSFSVPFMSGFGGITVAMAPNGITYYYVSDNSEWAWAGAVDETAKIAPMC